MLTYLWWLRVVWIPAQFCVQTQGAVRPREPQAAALCDAALAKPPYSGRVADRTR